MDLINYQSRMKFMDSIVSSITDNTLYKGYIVFTFHLLFAINNYLFMFFTNNFYVFLITVILYIIQVLLNIIDGGCCLLKLERQYLGKEWYGFYHILDYLSIPYTKNVVLTIYGIFATIVLSFIVYKFHKFLSNKNNSL